MTDALPAWTGDTAALRAVHPRFDDFLAVRDRLDPGRVLAGPHLERILGA